MRDWLSRIDKDLKAERDKRIFDLWLACWTQEQIAEEVGAPRQIVQEILPKMAELPKSAKPAAEHLTDFQVPLYNVWNRSVA